GPFETADVSITNGGGVQVHSGGTSLGQGIETALATIAAKVFDVNTSMVTVVDGVTMLQPFGGGSWASRSTVVGGSAVHLGAVTVRDQALRMASRVLEVAEDDLSVRGGRIEVYGVP